MVEAEHADQVVDRRKGAGHGFWHRECDGAAMTVEAAGPRTVQFLHTAVIAGTDGDLSMLVSELHR
jgi:hypothetical protein